MSTTSSPGLRTTLSAITAVALAANLLMIGAAAAQAEPETAGPSGIVLVVVNSSSLADAAVAASLVAAGLADAVVFAESADTVAFDDARVILDREPVRLVLVGGAAALSGALEAELRGLVDGVHIDRLAGVDRVDTAALAAQLVLEDISRRSAALEGVAESTVVLANAWSQRDVGTAAAAVIAGGADVLLYSHEGQLGSQTAKVLREHQPDRLVVAGTPETFSHDLVTQALLSADATATPTRLDGTTGAHASTQAVRLAAPGDVPIAVLSSGYRSQDISVALALAAALGRVPVLLTNFNGQLGNDAKTLLLEHQPEHIVIVNTEDQYSGEFLIMSLELFAPTATVRQLKNFSFATLLALSGIDVPDRSVRRGFTSISIGDNHVCGLRQNGTVACWSTDSGGKATPPDGTFIAVAAGGVFTCALRTDGTPHCWGDTSSFVSPVPDGPFVDITAGWGHACGLTADRSVQCWGDRWGSEFLIPSGAPFIAISAGRHHTCGLEPSRTAKCWGKAKDDQLNAPDGVFVAVTAGATHSCALELTGALECWGDRAGDGSVFPDEYAARRYLSMGAGSDTTCAVRPTQLIDCWGDDAIENVPPGLYTSVSVGDSFACALRTSTSVVCWGSLPDVTWEPFGPASFSTPITDRVARTGYRSVSAGHNHVCAPHQRGDIVCWGNDAHGKSTSPGGKFAAVAAGGVITCGLRADGSTQCWGKNESRRTGPYADITAGWSHACGRLARGAIECWGDGGGSRSDVPSGQFTEIAAGRRHTCAVEQEKNRVLCWGSPERLRLVAPQEHLQSISGGSSHACGLTNVYTIRCWGDRSAFPEVSGDALYISVAVGPTITCAIRPDQAVDCWGSAFIEDEPPGKFEAVTVGGSFACALRTSTSVVCWGDQPSVVWDPFSISGTVHVRD